MGADTSAIGRQVIYQNLVAVRGKAKSKSIILRRRTTYDITLSQPGCPSLRKFALL